MRREQHLEYCKLCVKQKLDFKRGLICELTNQIADFEDECNNFEIDKSKVDQIRQKNNKIRRTRFAYGFSPKQSDEILISDLSRKQIFVLAHEAAVGLKWNIGFHSDSGFIAFTALSLLSWSEEVQIKVEYGRISIKSECTGSQFTDFGKNRKNIRQFESMLNKLMAEVDSIDIGDKYNELASIAQNNDNDISKQAPLSEKEKISGLFSILTPSQGYYITPILIIINIFVFIMMVANGVDFFMPSNESLLLWGANYRPSTSGGEWWRLLSSTFVHIGVFHLLMNMYALLYIGILLEPYIGKVRFLSAYILSGIIGSVASIYWNEITIGAGASGAIFGMYGVFLAMLSTNIIDKSARKPLLISIGVFVVYNLVNGMQQGIDNAAHIGGLISGAIIGYSFYPSIKIPNPRLKYGAIGLISILFLLTSFVVLENTKSDMGMYNKDIDAFVILESRAIELYDMPANAPQIELVTKAESGIQQWERCIAIMENTKNYDLPEIVYQRNEKLLRYCRLRILCYNIYIKAIKEDTHIYDQEFNRYNMEINDIIGELTY